MEYIPVFINIVVTIMLLLGILLTLLGLPGNFLILAVAVLYAWQQDFSQFTWFYLWVLIGLWGFGEILEFISGMLGAKKQKASKWAIIASFGGGLLGGIIGTGILPVIGTVLGAVLGGFAASFYAEYLYTKDKVKAKQVAKGVVKGQLWGLLAKVSVAVSMAVIIFYRLWFE